VAPGCARCCSRAHGVATLPQIFIGGEFIGGCTDLFDRLKAGLLVEPLQRAGVSWDTAANDDPYAYLPRWMQPR